MKGAGPRIKAKKVTEFIGPGGGGHQANFIAAMRSRRTLDLAAPVEGGAISSALCHLGNISYRLGENTANTATQQAVQAHEPTKDALARMMEHLAANGVNTAAAPTVVGPSLKLVAGKESFVEHEKYDAGYWANTLLRRECRKPFVVPENV